MSFVAEAHEHLALWELNAALVALVDRMLLAFDTAEHVRLWEDRRRQAALRRAAGVGRKGPPHPPPPSRGAATDGPAAVALPPYRHPRSVTASVGGSRRSRLSLTISRQRRPDGSVNALHRRSFTRNRKKLVNTLHKRLFTRNRKSRVSRGCPNYHCEQQTPLRAVGAAGGRE